MRLGSKCAESLISRYFTTMEKQGILTERNVVVEVLEKYRKLPHLWNPTHKLYTNKIARREGLEVMLKSWQKLEPNATLECIRKKLNNWRAAYRRERKKVEDSLINASDSDEYHKPNLWYYDYLTFIHDDCPVLSKDDDDILNNMPSCDDIDHEQIDEDHIEEDDGDNNDDNEEDGDESNKEEPEKKPRIPHKRKNNERSSKLEKIDDSLQIVCHSNDESSADLFGRAIGSQLKEVSKFQRCLAEKLISEIMFYAKLEQLTIATSVNLQTRDS